MKDLEKMKKIANVLDKILSVFRVLVVVAFAVITVVGFVSAFAPKNVENGELFVGWQLGNMKVVVSDGDMAEVYDALGSKGWVFALVTMFIAMAACAAAFIFLTLIKKMLAPIKEGQPFSSDMPKYFKIMALVNLICSPTLFGFTAINEVVLENLKNSLPETVEIATTSSASLNLSFLFTSAFLLILAYIFEYGNMLQKQSDETL